MNTNTNSAARCTSCEAGLIRELSRARAFELNSISEYSYLSIIFADCLPELSALFDKISMDEMVHHRRLGEMILELGGDPAERVAVRNSGKINLCEDIHSRAPVAAARSLRANIRAECRDEENYRRLAGIAERCGLLSHARTLEGFALDEARHKSMQKAHLV